MLKIISKTPQGISTLIIVIVVSAVVMLIAVTAALKGIEETKIGFQENEALETFSATDSCLDEAVLNLNKDRNYTGEVLVVGDTTCTITVSGSGTSRTINVNSTQNGEFTRELEVDIDWSADFEITAWREILD